MEGVGVATTITHHADEQKGICWRLAVKLAPSPWTVDLGLASVRRGYVLNRMVQRGTRHGVLPEMLYMDRVRVREAQRALTIANHHQKIVIDLLC